MPSIFFKSILVSSCLIPLEGVSDLTTIASALMTAAEAKVESGSLGSTSMGSWSVPIVLGVLLLASHLHRIVFLHHMSKFLAVRFWNKFNVIKNVSFFFFFCKI
jgi:hypothetical protein